MLTDSDDVSVTTIESGLVSLALSTSPFDFGLSGASPGDSGSVQELTLTNNGTTDLRYSLTSVTTEDSLAAELDLDVWLESAEASTGDGCTDAWAPTGGYLYQGAFGSIAGTLVLGDPTQGADAGDRDLTTASPSEVLCFDVTLPSSATSQGTSTAATFTFDSEQTTNNP